MKTTRHRGFQSETITGKHLGCACLLAGALAAGAADVYTFESLAINNFIDGQDGWQDHPGQGDAVVSLDASGNGTKVVRHHKIVVFDEIALLTRSNDANFNFLPFDGTETNAVIQFEANGEHVAMLALGTDLNGDKLLTAAAGEIGPSFGVYDRNFRIQQANLGTAYDDGFNQGGGDGNSGNDWYRIQLRIDFTANDGDGSGSLYFMNLTDNDTAFHSVTNMRDKPLGLKRLAAGAAPAHWNAMHLSLLSNGSNVPSIDNLIPNGSTLRWTQVAMQDNQLLLAWRGGIGPYQLQQSPDLGLASWQNLGTATTLTTRTVEASLPRRFFRVTQPLP
jgi:hypothetical protein